MVDSPTKNGTSFFLVFYLFTFVVSLYLFSFSFFFVEYSIQRLEETRSIIENFDLSIPESFSIGVKGIDGRSYSLYGLGWHVLAVPFYLMGKYVFHSPELGVAFISPFTGGLAVVLVYLFTSSLGYSKRSSLITGLCFGFGTLLWPYSKSPGDGCLEALFILLSVYSLYRYIIGRKSYFLVFSATFLGIALNHRPTSFLVLPALVFLLIVDHIADRRQSETVGTFVKNMTVFLVVLFSFSCIYLWYNYYRFGSIFETGYQLVSKQAGIDFFTGTPLWTGLQGLLTSPGKGFFYYSPVALLFFPSIIPFYRKNTKLAIAFAMIILFYIFFISKNIYWHGDWAWGPRYLFPITPFLVIPAAGLFDSMLLETKRWGKACVYIIVALGVGIQIIAISVHPYSHFYHLQLEKEVPFTSVQTQGNPSIFEPPMHIYFEWKRSPIVSQVRYIFDMGKKMPDYRMASISDAPSWEERMNAYPFMHLFDFWWVYLYYMYNSYSGFLGALALLLVTVVSGLRLEKMSRCHRPGG